MPTPVCLDKPGPSQSTQLCLSDNSDGYDQTLRKNNLKLTELQLYINNIARCIVAVVFLSASNQDH